MKLLKPLYQLARRFRKSEDGTATLEFALIFPMFAYIIMGGYEIGYYTVSSAMLDQGVDRAVRDVRLGRNAVPTLANLKTATCQYARYVRNCEENITIALEPVNANSFSAPAQIAECIDRTENIVPAVTFQDGGENELMIVRVCVIVDPIFPTTWLGAALEGTPGSGYAIVSTSAFVNEPNT